jgi:Fe-S-cluster containining protein
MSAYTIDRPVWRKFRARWLARAATHVRRGGHAVIERDDGGVELLLGVGEDGKITELGLWSVLAIEQQRWRRVKDGPAKGLASVKVRDAFGGSVVDWCDRDSVHAGSTRRIELDCLECGACCHQSNVVLDEDDFARWREAGRKDLFDKAYLKKKNGRVTLRFLENGRCRNLGRDNKCGIYAIRPDNCSVFVVGSECCLAAREDTLKIRDGLPAEES